MKYQAVTFKLKVYKDQGTAANYGKIIAAGDTVTLAVRNDLGVETAQDVTVTKVSDGGRTIQWDGSAHNQTITEDVARVHTKHEFYCPGLRNFRATLSESGATPASNAMGVTSITLNGAVIPIGTIEASASAGILAQFVTDTVNKINTVLGGEGKATGVVTGSAGTQLLTLEIKGTSFNWTAIATVGSTTVQPVLF